MTNICFSCLYWENLYYVNTPFINIKLLLQTLTSLQNVETSAGTSEFVTAQSTQTIVNISNTDQSGTSSSKEEELIVKSEEKTPDEEIIVEADILSDEVKFDETEPEEELEDEGKTKNYN